MMTNCTRTLQHIATCLHCQAEIRKIVAGYAGSHTSHKKAETSRLNGMKGGRPKYDKR